MSRAIPVLGLCLLLLPVRPAPAEEARPPGPAPRERVAPTRRTGLAWRLGLDLSLPATEGFALDATLVAELALAGRLALSLGRDLYLEAGGGAAALIPGPVLLGAGAEFRLGSLVLLPALLLSLRPGPEGGEPSLRAGIGLLRALDPALLSLELAARRTLSRRGRLEASLALGATEALGDRLSLSAGISILHALSSVRGGIVGDTLVSGSLLATLELGGFGLSAGGSGTGGSGGGRALLGFTLRGGGEP